MRLSRFAFALVGCTFVLMMMGGIVHSTGSSLACPDWPLCYGSALPKMEGKVAVEHSHRLVASTVGLLTIALAAWLARRQKPYRRLLPLGLLAIFLVVGQGVLGGLTVIFKLPPTVSTAHLATSMIFLATLVTIALKAQALESAAPRLVVPRIWRFLLGAFAAALYAQMVIGALTRHTGGALACVDLPLCKGQIFPDGAPMVVLLHMTHRLNALVVGALAIVLGVGWNRLPIPGVYRALALGLPVLVALQITLGVLSIQTFLSLPIVTGHLAVAACLWMVTVALLVMTHTRIQMRRHEEPSPLDARSVRV